MKPLLIIIATGWLAACSYTNYDAIAEFNDQCIDRGFYVCTDDR